MNDPLTPVELVAIAFRICDLDCSTWDDDVLLQLAKIAIDALNSDPRMRLRLSDIHHRN